jgi:hypothetical protein
VITAAALAELCGFEAPVLFPWKKIVSITIDKRAAPPVNTYLGLPILAPPRERLSHLDLRGSEILTIA